MTRRIEECALEPSPRSVHQRTTPKAQPSTAEAPAPTCDRLRVAGVLTLGIATLTSATVCHNATAELVDCPATILHADDGEPQDQYGNTVAIAGDVVAIGAVNGGSPAQSNSGSVYLYRSNSDAWGLEEEFAPAVNGDQFGSAIALQAEWLFVGARLDDIGPTSNRGSVYIYRNTGSGWNLFQPPIVGSGGGASDLFGTSLDVQDEFLIVGAPGHLSRGAVYVFEFDGSAWAETVKLMAPIADGDVAFGSSVALTDSWIAVGAPTYGPQHSGAGYIFRHDGQSWQQQQRLELPTPDAEARLGTSVAMLGTTLVLGAPGTGVYVGSALVFDLGGDAWSQSATLLPPIGLANQAVGSSVTIAVWGIALGRASNFDTGGPALLYRRLSNGAWLFAGPAEAPELAYNGSANGVGDIRVVAADAQGRLAVGAPLASFEETLDWYGVAAVFDLSPASDCNANFINDACDISSGTSTDCNVNGVPDECDVAAGAPDLNHNDIPDECEADCNQNGLPDFIELDLGLASDCNYNAVLDECDIAWGVSLDLDGNGVPDECETDCNGNLIPDFIEIIYGLVIDCDDNGVPDGCETDCNANGVVDACDIADGTSLDCNLNAIPDDCEADCNANGVPDDCDLFGGTSPDCNANGLPDECDLAAGTSADCNANLVPDECDLASGASADCNANLVPDECDITNGTSNDADQSGVPDECECLADVTGNGMVDFADLLDLLSAWGTCPGGGPAACPADINGDEAVDFADLLMVLAAWGECG